VDRVDSVMTGLAGRGTPEFESGNGWGRKGYAAPSPGDGIDFGHIALGVARLGMTVQNRLRRGCDCSHELGIIL
jgi:hypothetical protein